MNVLDCIIECAKIPSFSTYEERLHPFIYDFIDAFNNVTIDRIKENNLCIRVPGKKSDKTVALTAHLDKINHFESSPPETLGIIQEHGRLIGQMDDAVGVGICLHLIQEAHRNEWPELIILFSEMEESFGLRHHPHLLKNGGRDVAPQIGARRLCSFLEEAGIAPSLFVTIDTTPVFKGESGVALYSEHWEKTGVLPDAELLNKIEVVRSFILEKHPAVRPANGNNDYLEYGRYFGVKERGNIPSIALEPAIYPYHQIGEGVYVKDVPKVVSIIVDILEQMNVLTWTKSSTESSR